MWFMLCTVTPALSLDPAVYPRTWRGKAFIVIVIVIGILFLAMPLSTIGTSFNSVWEERQMVKLQRLVRQLLVENSMSANDVKVAFQQFDTDDSGEITYSEFVTCVHDVLGLQLPRNDMVKLWRKLDEARVGFITYSEFTDAIFPGAVHSSHKMEFALERFHRINQCPRLPTPTLALPDLASPRLASLCLASLPRLLSPHLALSPSRLHARTPARPHAPICPGLSSPHAPPPVLPESAGRPGHVTRRMGSVGGRRAAVPQGPQGGTSLSTSPTSRSPSTSVSSPAALAPRCSRCAVSAGVRQRATHASRRRRVRCRG